MNRDQRRCRILLTLALLPLAVTACAARSEPALPRASAEAIGLSPAALERMSTALQSVVATGQRSGMYAVITRHGRIG